MYRFRGKLDNNSTVSAKLPGAPNFMAALGAAGKLLQDKLKADAGKIVRFTLFNEAAEESFKVRTPRPKKK